MKEETALREEILKNVVEIYKLRRQNEKFIKNESRVNYAGRVFDEKEMVALIDSALDFWLTLGHKGIEFTKKFSEYLNTKHTLVVNSGSSANLIAISTLCSKALKNPLNDGDEVITPAVTFPTTLNPIIQNRLMPVFVDIESGTYNIDSSKIEAALSDKTRAIFFPHTLGNPADMDKIMEIAKKNNLYVVEDTCDALGSKYGDKYCGTFGDFSTFSFYAAHHITMGEGGAVCTNSDELYKVALSIRDWGRACFCETGEKNPNGACGHRFDYKFSGMPEGYDHKYIYTNIGYNLKPLDIQCAMGIEQIDKLPLFVAARKINFDMYYNFFKSYEDRFILPRTLPKADPSWFGFPLTIKKDAGFSRKEIVTFLESRNIETRMLFAGNILYQPAYRSTAFRVVGNLTNTENVLQDTFFLGVYPGLTEEKLSYVLECLNEFLKR